jgi:hypothetical protein
MTTSPSPFIPGTNIQFAWDSTCLGYIKACPRLYQYIIIEGYVPRDDSIHLRFGAEFHSAIQDYENFRADGLQFEDAVLETVRNLLSRIRDWDPDPTLKAFTHKNKNQLLHLVIAYLDNYRDDPCETFLLNNGRPAVELSFRFDLDFGPTTCGDQLYMLCGHLDRVVTYQDDLFVLDHKTTQTTPTDYFFAGFAPNNQMTLYTYGGKVVLDTPLAGVMIEAAQVCNDAPMKFVRRPTYRSDEYIDEWLDDLEWHLVAAESYAKANYWPQNDTSCGMYGGCKFREVCSKPAAVRERFLRSDFTKLPQEERWNPLKSR